MLNLPGKSLLSWQTKCHTQWEHHQNFGINFICLADCEQNVIKRLEYNGEQLAIVENKGHRLGTMGQ
jgi:hypothetical protein